MGIFDYSPWSKKMRSRDRWVLWNYPVSPVPDQHEKVRACNCIGPRNGEPLCKCMMRGVRIIDGRYVKIQDLGPAPKEKP